MYIYTKLRPLSEEFQFFFFPCGIFFIFFALKKRHVSLFFLLFIQGRIHKGGGADHSSPTCGLMGRPSLDTETPPLSLTF